MPDFNQKQAMKKGKFYDGVMPRTDPCLQNKEYFCTNCKIVFNNKIEYERHKDKGVCDGEETATCCTTTKVFNEQGERGGGTVCPPPVLTYNVGKHIFNTKYEYEKFLGEFDSQEQKERRNGYTDLHSVGKANGGHRRIKFKGTIIKGTGDSVSTKPLPIERFNLVEATESREIVKPPPTGRTPVTFYQMAEDVLGPDYYLSWLKVGETIMYEGIKVPIVEVWENGTYWIEYYGKKIRKESTYSKYNNLTKQEMDDVVAKYNAKHSQIQYVDKKYNPELLPSQQVPAKSQDNYTFGRTTYNNKVKYCNGASSTKEPRSGCCPWKRH